MPSCSQCGMVLADQAEFHPHSFCLLKQAGLDPWRELAWLNRQLGVDVKDWPDRPPPVRNLPISEQAIHLPAAIAEALGTSRSEARRLIAAGAVKVDGVAVQDADVPAALAGSKVKVGRRREFALGQEPSP